jgi:hypothetical protein
MHPIILNMSGVANLHDFQWVVLWWYRNTSKLKAVVIVTSHLFWCNFDINLLTVLWFSWTHDLISKLVIATTELVDRRVCKIAKSDYYLCPSLSVWNNSASMERIFMKFDMRLFLKSLLRKFKFHKNVTRRTGTLHEALCTYITIPNWIILRRRNGSDKSYRENKNTHIMFSKFFPKIVPSMS